MHQDDELRDEMKRQEMVEKPPEQMINYWTQDHRIRSVKVSEMVAGLRDGELFKTEETAVAGSEEVNKPERFLPWWARLPSDERWETPETDDEDDAGPWIPGKWDDQGKRFYTDHWTSPWRTKVAEEVNNFWMNKTVSVPSEIRSRVCRGNVISSL